MEDLLKLTILTKLIAVIFFLLKNFSAKASLIFWQKRECFTYSSGGGRVVRWCWVNFQCRGVLLIWNRVGQGPIALAIGAGGGCFDIFPLCYHYAPPQKVAGYYVIPSELLSVCPSVRPSVRLSVLPSVRPSAVEHSCPVHNFDTVRDNFTKLGTNVKHNQTTCRD